MRAPERLRLRLVPLQSCGTSCGLPAASFPLRREHPGPASHACLTFPSPGTRRGAVSEVVSMSACRHRGLRHSFCLGLSGREFFCDKSEDNFKSPFPPRPERHPASCRRGSPYPLTQSRSPAADTSRGPAHRFSFVADASRQLFVNFWARSRQSRRLRSNEKAL